MRFIVAAIVVTLAGAALGAQADRFEVASVKPSPSSARGAPPLEILPGGSVRGTSVPLWWVVQIAYGLRMKQLDWDSPLLDERYDINAKAGSNGVPDTASADARRKQINAMLRSMLTERFKLSVHVETRTLTHYALVVGKGGHKLKPSPQQRSCDDPASPCRFGGGPAGGIRGDNVEIWMLADALNSLLDRPVVDRTALKGQFVIDLPPWNPGVQPPSGGVADGTEPAPNPAEASIFTVLQERLGLRLESIRGPYEIHVVDHVERPTPD
jgi:uncharacterized protein (TIGR03435 family)